MCPPACPEIGAPQKFAPQPIFTFASIPRRHFPFIPLTSPVQVNQSFSYVFVWSLVIALIGLPDARSENSILPPAPQPSVVGSSNVIYSGLKDIVIPTDFSGVYLNIGNGSTGTSSFAGWDFNLVFGGERVYNSPSFQPVRTGSGFEDAVRALTAGTLVDGSLTYSSSNSYGASNTHLGNGAGQFQPGSEAYLGFQYTTEANDGPHYGWMRVVFTADQPGGLIRDWAYDTGTTGMTPTSIQAGNILQAAPVSGLSVVTLTGTQSATLGSALSDPGSGVVAALTKNGANTWTMSGDKTYTGATTINQGVLEVDGKLSGTSAITVNGSGSLRVSGPGGTDVKLNNSAPVTLAGGKIDLSGMTSSLNQTVGALTLTVNSILDFGALLAGNTFKFGASNADWSGVQLAIYNYTGGADHLFFGSNTSSLNAGQLDRIFFYSDGGNDLLGSGQYFGGTGEIVPVPEPATWVAGALLLIAHGHLHRRHAFKRLRRPAAAGSRSARPILRARR